MKCLTRLGFLLAVALHSSPAAAFDTIVVFNEIQYHPAGNDDPGLEFVELHNQNSVNVDLSGWRLSGGIDFVFPEGTVIDGKGYLVIAANPASLEAAAGITGVLGPFTGMLNNGGERLRLRNHNNRIMNEVEYNDRHPWPVSADGSGASLAKRDPFLAGDVPEHWRGSPQSGGTPGMINFPDDTVDPPTATVRKLDLDAVWRYNESGEDLGTNWAQTAHAGGGNWGSGPGILAYETALGAGIGTTFSPPALNNPYVITYYLEIEFTLTQEEFNSNFAIQFTHRIDNGAIFYLNGTEVLRDNMPGGPVSFDDTASGSGEFTVEGPISIPTGSLIAGQNRISVEVHQGTVGSSDVVFGLEVDALQLLPDPNKAPRLRINEVASAQNPSWWLEIHNGEPSAVNVGGMVIAGSASAAQEYELPAQMVAGGGYLVVNASQLGFSPLDGDRVFLYGEASKSRVLDAVEIKNRVVGRKPDDIDGAHLTPNAGTPGAANTFSFHDEIVINEIIYHHRPVYAREGDPPAVQFVPVAGYGQDWRYNETGDDLGTNWALAANPAGGDWLTGPGPLGWETSSGLANLPEPLGTIISQPVLNDPLVTTHYFETDFMIDGADLPLISEIIITHMVDDGAVFHLNGQEVERFNMPATGAIQSSTLASGGREAVEVSFAAGPENLVAGLNRLSVEVHQNTVGSSDIIMGAKIDARLETPGPNPPSAYVQIDEEWVELHNKSSSPVDVSGWELERAVTYTLPAGTTIPAGGYLVVANDVSAFSAKFPGVPVLGDYSGNLSNRGEELMLSDDSGNPVDSFFYRDDRPWPEHADGGGSSLELRNPLIEKKAPEAWRASDNTQSSVWRNYQYTLTANTPGSMFAPPISNFHELRLGLLDAGVILLDDISVVEDPGGANIELIANGDFNDSSGWRLLGTHQHSEVVSDGGGNVLKVVAVDRMNYMNNLLESNLTNNGGALRPVQDGTDYRISFRAKWISGSPQFRFELYYNKLAETVILDQPLAHGTPGAQNSTYEANTGPVFLGLTHTPAVPEPNESIEVSTAASDPDGIRAMTLRYSVNGGAFSSASMSFSASDGLWKGIIPGQADNALVHFYVEGQDDSPGQLTSFAPAGGPDSRAIIEVDDSTVPPGKNSVRLNMLSSETGVLHNSDLILSNDRFGCTMIVNEKEIAYDSGMRLRGSMFSRNNSGSTALNLKFPSDRRYRGVHSTITTRKGNIREILVKHIINQAGGVHDNYNDIFHQFGHISAQNGRVRAEMGRFGSAYLKGLPGGQGEDGTVFKMEGIRVFQATQDGTPNTPKTPFPIGWVPAFDIADQGTDKELYRHNMRINSHLDKDDYESMIRMCQTFSLSGQELEDAVPDAIDVDMWTRQFAVMSLCGIGDTYSQGNPHNLNFYVRPGDGIVEPMPWDWDFTFNRAATSPLWGNRNVSKIFARPVYTRLFHGHLLDVINNSYNTGYLSDWFSHYGTCAGEGYTGNLSYVTSRGNHVLSQLPAQVNFQITTNGGGSVTTSEPSVTLAGNGWIDVREVFVSGAPEPVPLTWLDGDSWELTIPVATGTSTVMLSAVNHQGEVVGGDSIQVTNTGTVEPATGANLMITELHYHPASDLAEEFVELQNIDQVATIDLSGVAFVNGITFTFASGTMLAPGERLLVVQDSAAFSARYGAGLPVVGVFANATQLANSGERIRLEALGGAAIHDFTFDDNHPWPQTPDGGGPSLVLIAPVTGPDHANPLNWRASTAIGGNPGATDAVAFSGDPDADDDGDGLSNFMNHALGAGSPPPRISIDTNGMLEFEYARNLAADDVGLTVEVSTNLNDWNSSVAILELQSQSVPVDGVETVVYRSINAASAGSGPQFVRLRAVERE